MARECLGLALRTWQLQCIRARAAQGLQMYIDRSHVGLSAHTKMWPCRQGRQGGCPQAQPTSLGCILCRQAAAAGPHLPLLAQGAMLTPLIPCVLILLYLSCCRPAITLSACSSCATPPSAAALLGRPRQMSWASTHPAASPLALASMCTAQLCAAWQAGLGSRTSKRLASAWSAVSATQNATRR